MSRGGTWGSRGPGCNATTLRALNFQPRAQEILRRLRGVEHVTLGEVCEDGQLSRGLRFPRVDGEPGDTYSYRLVGQRQAFWLRPEGRWISKAYTSDEVLAKDETVLVASQGTLGENEVYCRSILVTGAWRSNAFSEHFLRVRPGWASAAPSSLRSCAQSLFFVRCGLCRRAASSRTSTRTCKYIPVPVLTEADRDRIAETVRKAYRQRDEADRKEDQALAKLEAAVVLHSGVATG